MNWTIEMQGFKPAPFKASKLAVAQTIVEGIVARRNGTEATLTLWDHVATRLPFPVTTREIKDGEWSAPISHGTREVF